MPDVAGIMRLVVGVAGCKRTQPVRGQQPLAAQRDDASLQIRRERGMRQANREDLVRPDRAVIAGRPVDHVVEPAGPLVGETSETDARVFGEATVRICRPAERLGKAGHDAHRIVPQRIDLDRLADARRHDPIADLGIHPAELHPGFAGTEQPIAGIHLDAVAGAPPMPFHHIGEDRKHVGEALAISARLDIGTPGLEKPQAGIDGVVLGLGPGARKDIGQHAAVDETGEGQQDVTRPLPPAGRQGQSRQ